MWYIHLKPIHGKQENKKQNNKITRKLVCRLRDENEDLKPTLGPGQQDFTLCPWKVNKTNTMYQATLPEKVPHHKALGLPCQRHCKAQY